MYKRHGKKKDSLRIEASLYYLILFGLKKHS